MSEIKLLPVVSFPSHAATVRERLPAGAADELRRLWVQQIGAAGDVGRRVLYSRVAQASTRGIFRDTPADVAEAARIEIYRDLLDDKSPSIDDDELLVRVHDRIVNWPMTYATALDQEAKRVEAARIKRREAARRATVEEIAHGQDPHAAA